MRGGVWPWSWMTAGRALYCSSVADPYRGAALHRVVLLRRRQRMMVAGLDDLEPRAEPGRIRRAQQEGVELLRGADRVADPAGAAAAVAEEHRDRLGRVAGHDEDRHPHRVAAVAELDDVAVTQAALVGQALGNPRGRVPGQLRERLRQLLQPAVVREAAVPDGGIGPEDDLESAGLRRRRALGGRRRCGGCGSRLARRGCGRSGGCWLFPRARRRRRSAHRDAHGDSCAGLERGRRTTVGDRGAAEETLVQRRCATRRRRSRTLRHADA